MKRVSRRQLVCNLAILLAIGVVIYFPESLIPPIKTARKLFRLPELQDPLFPGVFTFAQYPCSFPCPFSDTVCCDYPATTSGDSPDPSGSPCFQTGSCDPTILSCPSPPDRPCNFGQNCNCLGQQVFCDTPPNQTCTNSCQSCSCTNCSPPACLTSHQGADNDGDGWESDSFPSTATGCDCNDTLPNGRFIYPGNANRFCDCNAGTGHDGLTAAQGVSELSFCECLSPPGPPGTPCTEFNMQCYCLNNRDDNCNGLVDMDDPECPDPAQQRNWVISRPFRLTISLTGTRAINGDVYIIGPSGALTIAAGIRLQIKKPHGLHIAPGRWVDPESAARIEFVN